MNSVTSPPVAGLAASAANSMRTRHLALGQRLLGLLAEDEDAHHRVGVRQLAVVDEQREPAQVVGLGDDHALGAARRDHEVGADRVRVVVDPRDHPRQDVLDVAAELVLGDLRERRHDAEERRERGQQRQDVVLLGLLPEQLLELLHLLGVLGGEVVGLAEVVGQVVELDGVVIRVPHARARMASAPRA